MPRSEEAEHFTNAVYAAVQQIPFGRVTSYSHIAGLLDSRTLPFLSLPRLVFIHLGDHADLVDGVAKKARQVGIALKSLPSEDSAGFFHSANVPWQRVVNARGGISPRYVFFIFLFIVYLASLE